MAKKKKFPKMPKAGASMATLNRYEAKCKDIKKFNDAIDKAKSDKLKKRESIRKLKAKA